MDTPTTHLSKIERGLKFFSSLSTLCYAGIAITMVSSYFQSRNAIPHPDLEGVGWTALSTLLVGGVRSLPLILFAAGLWHVRNLFGAVRDAIHDLQTTV